MTPKRAWACPPPCGMLNRSTERACTSCGLARGEAPTPTADTPTRRQCPYDGATLLASGLCQDGGGYPLGTKCPFSCPVCRGPLGWAGDCPRCWGVQHDGDPRCFPGDRYELFDDNSKPIGDGQHWTLLDRGPRGLIPREHSRAVAALLSSFAGQRAEGPASIAEVFERLPFRPQGVA